MARQAKTLMEQVYVRNRSFRETAVTTTFIIQWAFAMQQLKVDSLTMREYVTYWKGVESQAKAYRRFESFRRTFPDHPDPNAIAVEMISFIDDRMTEKQLVREGPMWEVPPAVFA